MLASLLRLSRPSKSWQKRCPVFFGHAWEGRLDGPFLYFPHLWQKKKQLRRESIA
jgi:hypothetical protein